ncbi:hypothetical protein HBH70_158030 [Parastagonospora nodorum]|nr:hypothetical protein HBH47_133430 [Parastagonospora nodorum]KAH4204393.1 hypothetical protein HBI95_152090 [Parastagonospora nodorum]KAH4601579.1 hypothetical protein HBH82_173930 [Parastagonospora nodorum]KAH4677167.1 hypothetical protein HBH78_152250 [Parastagonospora nodorum]KAH4700756.1 hypothetical protein HBH67_138760 [Parastagonospora nodorum]
MSFSQSQAAHARLPEGLCAMWAVIVVARLDAKLPSWDQAAELEANRDGRWASWARSAFEDFALTFSDYQPDVGWTVVPTSVANSLLGELVRTASNYYQDSDREFMQLCTMLREFHRKLHIHRAVSLGSFAYSMQESIHDLVRQLLDPSVSEIIITVNTMTANMSANDLSPAVDEYVQAQASILTNNIEVFVRQQTSLILRGETDLCSDGIVDAIRAPLRDHVREALNRLMAGFQSISSKEIDMGDFEARFMLSVFFRDVARFFSYASPLLRHYWEPDFHSSDADDSDGIIIDDGDRVWYWQEHELSELEDVLTGPENVDIDRVSIPVTVLQPFDCSICLDQHTEIRQLNACSHAFCGECLSSQLQTHHPGRYTCASCRAGLLI